MWSTIENFRESLSQITSDVLDAAEELETGGGSEQPGASDGGGSDGTSSRRRRQLSYSHQTEGDNHVSLKQNGKENNVFNPGNMPNGSLPKVKELQVHNRKLQAREKDLLSQISENNLAYTSLQDAHGKALTEISTLKEMLTKEREELSNAKTQLQRDWKAAEEANRDNKRLKMEKQKMSLEITELKRRLTEQVAETNNARDHTRAEVLKEMEPTLFLKDEKAQQLQALVKDLEKENLQLQDDVKRLKQRQINCQQSVSTEEMHADDQSNKISTKGKDTSKQATEILKDAEEAFELERKDYEKRLDAVCAERDKAVRDLKRLKQHLIEKEQSDSEKMEQDSKHITELKEKADASIMRAMHLEQTLAQTLAKQADASKKKNEQLEALNQEILNLKKKLAACISALESKDGELLNLQAALGQYYAESEAKDRLHVELSAARNELATLSDQLKVANSAMEVKNKEKEDLLEKLALQQKKVAESQEKTHKLEADILMLRRALEQSLTRLNRMSSDSDYYVDRRIVIKLLVTYFQRHQSKEVLDLMARMLGFSDEDKQAIGFAQQGGGKGVVRGVLGLPGRVVGGLLKTGSSSSMPSLSQTDNQSFSDLWIDFLLKESEEREKREVVSAEASALGNKQPASSPSAHRFQESRNLSYSKNTFGKAEASSTPTFTTETASFENEATSAIDGGDSTGSEFSIVPLNSTSSSSLVRSFLHPST